MRILIRNGGIVNAGGMDVADILIEGEKIVAVGSPSAIFNTEGMNGRWPRGDTPTSPGILVPPDVQVVDASECFVLPGGIDVHTHLDMPLDDITSSDDFYTGHVAAAFGGTTTHIDFANQTKGETLQSAVQQWQAKARDRACIDYGFHVTITDVNEYTLDEIDRLSEWGVTTIKMLMAYKGRIMVDDASLFLAMRRARDAGLLTMVHCENGDVIDILVREAIAAGHTEPRWHALTRPPQLEAEATGRAIAMAEILDAPLYIVHVTCESALQRIREARARGVNVHAETCVQYLYFTQDDLDRPDFEGAKWVCSPPFREDSDREALWCALRDSDLDIVSTDHCPFFFETQKVRGRDDFSRIPNGVPGIEDRMRMVLEGGINDRDLSMQRFVAITSANPARIFGLEDKGKIAPGYDADLVLWNHRGSHQVSVAGSHSRVDYSLYEGMMVSGGPEKVFRRGQLIVDGDQFLAQPGSGRFIYRSRPLLTGPQTTPEHLL